MLKVNTTTYSPSECGIRIAVMYGSQTGNADAISQELADFLRAEVDGTVIRCSLNEYIDSNELGAMAKDATCVLIVCSTTGNGEPPENALKFWRKLKARSLDKQLLSGLPYTVLALGDSNYDQFCSTGKQFHKRFQELGAVPMSPLYCVDAVGDMEDDVEKWIDSTVRLVKTRYGHTTDESS